MKKGLKTILIILAIMSGVACAFIFVDKGKIKGYIAPSRVFITGNIHGKMNIDRINEYNFPVQKELGENDNLIILGDFGLVWDEHIEDEMLLDELDKRKFNILFVDGTRENFDLLESEYEVVDIYGGKAHKIRDNIYHLMRGEVYSIGGKKYLTIGGGESQDKDSRIEGQDYWVQEMPSKKEWGNLRDNLDEANNYVDYILTHTPPSADLKIIGADIGRNLGKGSSMNKTLQKVSEGVKYKRWYHSYYHLDLEVSKKHQSIYNQIVEVK